MIVCFMLRKPTTEHDAGPRDLSQQAKYDVDDDDDDDDFCQLN